MDNALSYNAMMAWIAFGIQDYYMLDQYGKEVYNYFVHNPDEILKLDNPLFNWKSFPSMSLFARTRRRYTGS